MLMRRYEDHNAKHLWEIFLISQLFSLNENSFGESFRRRRKLFFTPMTQLYAQSLEFDKTNKYMTDRRTYRESWIPTDVRSNIGICLHMDIHTHIHTSSNS